MGQSRIYVGGLAADVKEADIAGRFKPFGDVADCEIVKGKGPLEDPSRCRGFAYLTFTAKDEAALARVFSLYNGCKWRGKKLRVELAKPDYLTKLQKEWTQEDQQQDQADAARELQDKQLANAQDAADRETNAIATVRIKAPGHNRKVVTVDLSSKSKSYRSWFPAHKEKRLADLSWNPLPQSKRVMLQQAAAAAVATAVQHAHKVKDPANVSATVKQQEQHWSKNYSGQHAAGAAVPYQYQSTLPAAKGSAALEQEHFGQLKLLKRIAHQEQQLQRQQFRLLQEQQPQQQEAPGVVSFSDDNSDDSQAVLSGAALTRAAVADFDRRYADDSEDAGAVIAAVLPAAKQRTPSRTAPLPQPHDQRLQQPSGQCEQQQRPDSTAADVKGGQWRNDRRQKLLQVKQHSKQQQQQPLQQQGLPPPRSKQQLLLQQSQQQAASRTQNASQQQQQPVQQPTLQPKHVRQQQEQLTVLDFLDASAAAAAATTDMLDRFGSSSDNEEHWQDIDEDEPSLSPRSSSGIQAGQQKRIAKSAGRARSSCDDVSMAKKRACTELLCPLARRISNVGKPDKLFCTPAKWNQQHVLD